jgi:hypothetical protein
VGRAQPDGRPTYRDEGVAGAALRGPGRCARSVAVRPAGRRTEPDDARDVRRRRPARAQPAPHRHGRNRRPAVLASVLDEPDQHVPGCDVHRPAADRPRPAQAAEAASARRADLLHRRDERPDRGARPGVDPARPDGPPRVVPDAHEGGPERHLRPLSREGGPRSRARHAEAARRDRPRHQRLLAGDDRAGLLDGADARPPRGDEGVPVGAPPRGDDDCRDGNGDQHRVRPRGDEGGRHSRGWSRRSGPRLHEANGVHAALDSHALRLARPPHGAREGGALQLVAERAHGRADPDTRRDGGRARFLRGELGRRGRRRSARDRTSGRDGGRLGHGARARA